MRNRRITYNALIWLGMIVAGLLILVQLQSRIEAVEKGPGAELELLWVPDIRVVHGLALGDDNTAADMLWLRSIFYLAEQHPELDHHHHHGEECPVCHGGSFGGEKHTHTADNEGHSLPHVHNNSIEGKIFGDPDTTITDEEISGNYDPLDFRHNRSLKTLLLYDVNSGKSLHLYRLLNTATDLDPMFASVYYQGAMNLGMIEGRYNEALKLINKGIKARPDRWEMHYYRGFIRLFYLNDKAGAAIDIQTAALKPDAPVIVVQLAAALQVGIGNVDMALEFLRSLIEVTDDPVMREKIHNMLEVYSKLVGKDDENLH